MQACDLHIIHADTVSLPDHGYRDPCLNRLHNHCIIGLITLYFRRQHKLTNPNVLLAAGLYQFCNPVHMILIHMRQENIAYLCNPL